MKTSGFNCQRRRPAWTLGAAACTIALMCAVSANAQTHNSSESVTEQELSAHSYQQHHYASPAERAEDALLIVKVKAAIADAGLADDAPLTVDADHGRVTLTGVLDSKADVAQAVALVAGIDGVKGINNRLTWQKEP